MSSALSTPCSVTCVTTHTITSLTPPPSGRGSSTASTPRGPRSPPRAAAGVGRMHHPYLLDRFATFDAGVYDAIKAAVNHLTEKLCQGLKADTTRITSPRCCPPI